MKREKKLFIFDLDGTLVNAYRAIENSLNYARRQFGYSSVSYANVKQSVGSGDVMFIREFFRKEHVEEALALYRGHHKSALKKYARLKPFAGELLKRLKESGKITAIASNRPSYYTDIVLDALRIKKYFAYVLCADQPGNLKPEPAMLLEILKKAKIHKQDAVYVGDMSIDMETARRAGMDAIFVSGGSSRAHEVRHYAHKTVVRSLKTIARLYCQSCGL